MLRKMTVIMAVVLVLSMVLAACQPAPAPTTVAEPTTAPEAQQPTDAPVAPEATKPPAEPEPTKAPETTTMEYQEAPMLAEMVAAGDLPPVAERLSAEPLVVEAIEEVGVYGGTWRRGWRGPADFHAYGRINYEPVLRWPRDPKDPVIPGLAKDWEFSEDGTEITLYFREGLRWSDGEPWTVDDIIFWWEAIETNPDLTTAPHAEWVVNGQPMTLIKVDDYTITLRFAGPNGLVLRMLAFHGNQWPLNFERFGFFAPEHYLTQFHPEYNTDVTDYTLFNEKADDLNPDRPVMTAWDITTYSPGDSKLIATRNPYYWKVDAEGKQLPYIDYIEMSLLENNEAIAAKALACEIDMQTRGMALQKFPLFKEKEADCDYRVFLWPNAQGSALVFWPNQSYTADPVLREVFQNKDFRIGLSYAIDRDQLNSISWLDQGVPRTSPVVNASPYFEADLETLYGQYDVALAAEHLDKAGLTMGADGVRQRPDGKPLELTIETERTGTDLDAIQLVSEMWTAVGVKTVVQTMTRDLFWPRATGNEVQISVWSTDRGLEPFVDPIYMFPFDNRSWMGPLFGVYYNTGGKDGEAPTGKMLEAQELYNTWKQTIDPEEQLAIGKQIVRIAVEEAWTISTVGMVPGPVIVKNNFRNVPQDYTQDWIYMSPGNLDPSHFFFKP